MRNVKPIGGCYGTSCGCELHIMHDPDYCGLTKVCETEYGCFHGCACVHPKETATPFKRNINYMDDIIDE